MRNILLALSFFLCALFALRIPVHSGEPNEFAIQIFREELVGKLIVGTLYVDGAKIGATYENNDWCVKAGTYRGYLRTKADKKIVAGPDGALGKEGDFLIEIAKREFRCFSFQLFDLLFDQSALFRRGLFFLKELFFVLFFYNI